MFNSQTSAALSQPNITPQFTEENNPLPQVAQGTSPIQTPTTKKKSNAAQEIGNVLSNYKPDTTTGSTGSKVSGGVQAAAGIALLIANPASAPMAIPMILNGGSQIFS